MFPIPGARVDDGVSRVKRAAEMRAGGGKSKPGAANFAAPGFARQLTALLDIETRSARGFKRERGDIHGQAGVAEGAAAVLGERLSCHRGQ